MLNALHTLSFGIGGSTANTCLLPLETAFASAWAWPRTDLDTERNRPWVEMVLATRSLVLVDAAIGGNATSYVCYEILVRMIRMDW